MKPRSFAKIVRLIQITSFFKINSCPKTNLSQTEEFLICIFFLKERKEECLYVRNSAPIVPQTWYHVCVGINTISGLLRIVDNGIPVLDEETEIFKNTSSIKPENISGKLLGDSIMIQIPLFGSDSGPKNATLRQELSIFNLAQINFKTTNN